MKRIITHTIVTAALCLSAACTKDKPAVPDSDGQYPLSITVSDAGYKPSSVDVLSTRVTENGYTTEFQPGDVCGLFIVNNGLVTEANVKLTAADDGEGGIVWESEYDLPHVTGNTYHLYYPWQDAPENVPEAGDLTEGGSDAGFFSGMIEAWRPAADQSDYETGYSASDLMTAIAQVSVSSDKAELSFGLTHTMALAEVKLPDGIVSARFASAVPCAFSESICRYIVNPVAGAVLSLLYEKDGLQYVFDIVIEANELTGGKFRTYELVDTADL